MHSVTSIVRCYLMYISCSKDYSSNYSLHVSFAAGGSLERSIYALFRISDCISKVISDIRVASVKQPAISQRYTCLNISLRNHVEQAVYKWSASLTKLQKMATKVLHHNYRLRNPGENIFSVNLTCR